MPLRDGPAGRVLAAGGSCSSQTAPAPHQSGKSPRTGIELERAILDVQALRREPRLQARDRRIDLHVAGPGWSARASSGPRTGTARELLPVRTKSLRAGSYPHVVCPVTPTREHADHGALVERRIGDVGQLVAIEIEAGRIAARRGRVNDVVAAFGGVAGAAVDMAFRAAPAPAMFMLISRFSHIWPPAIGVGSTRLTFEPVVPPTLLPSARFGSNR